MDLKLNLVERHAPMSPYSTIHHLHKEVALDNLAFKKLLRYIEPQKLLQKVPFFTFTMQNRPYGRRGVHWQFYRRYSIKRVVFFALGTNERGNE